MTRIDPNTINIGLRGEDLEMINEMTDKEIEEYEREFDLAPGSWGLMEKSVLGLFGTGWHFELKDAGIFAENQWVRHSKRTNAMVSAFAEGFFTGMKEIHGETNATDHTREEFFLLIADAMKASVFKAIVTQDMLDELGERMRGFIDQHKKNTFTSEELWDEAHRISTEIYQRKTDK